MKTLRAKPVKAGANDTADYLRDAINRLKKSNDDDAREALRQVETALSKLESETKDNAKHLGKVQSFLGQLHTRLYQWSKSRKKGLKGWPSDQEIDDFLRYAQNAQKDLSNFFRNYY